MLDLQMPWLLLLLPLPWLVYRYLPPYGKAVQSLRVPHFSRLAELTGTTPHGGAVVRRRSRFKMGILVLIWSSTVLALSKPVLKSEPVTIEKSARDLLLAVDLSGSMDTRDLKNDRGEPASRLNVVKEVVGNFVARRKGDRLGLMVFGAAPYIQVPFTLDTHLVTRLLHETETHMAGESTTIGDAMGLALRVFERSTASSRVLILLTDGNDTGSEVPPLTAARIAADRGLTIHVIGVGDPTLAGEERLNDAVLSEIARLTHGRYFHAANRKELSQIYDELDRLEQVKFESHTYTPTRSAFHYPLAVAAILIALVLAVSSISPRGSRGVAKTGEA